MTMIYCYECGKKYSAAAAECPYCGAPNKNNANRQRTWLVAFLLCFFLGVWGAHRFYTRQTTTAVIMLILGLTLFGLLITGIWAFVDLIILICHAGDDKYIQNLSEK